MSKQQVIHHPNSILRETSRELSVAEIRSNEIQRLTDDMMETMHLENGVGLAAPQVGEHIRLIICETPNGPRAFYNPRLVKQSKRMVDSEEGCLSIPGVYGIVSRHKSIKAVVQDREGNDVTIKTGGMLSIILQHEIDHLDGILFIDRAHTVKDLTKEKEASLV